MLVLRVERKGASGATVREEVFSGAEGSRTPDPTMPLWSCLSSIATARFLNDFGQILLDKNCERNFMT